MPKLSPSLRRRLILVALLAGFAAVGWLVLKLRHEARQRQVEACRQQRAELTRFRRDSFDSQLAQMRKLRLNPEQVTTLRRVDAAAYARYAQAFGDQVDRVAQAADRLGAMVDDYRAANCLGVE
jgi:uncharacterized protein HemX